MIAKPYDSDRRYCTVPANHREVTGGDTVLRKLALVSSLVLPFAAVLGYGGVYSWVWAPTNIAASAAVLILLWAIFIKRLPLPWHPILYPMLAFGFFVVCQWVFGWTLDRASTLTGILQLSGCISIFYLAFYASRDRKHRVWMPRILWLYCGLLAAEALFQHFALGSKIYGIHDASYAYPMGPYVNHDDYAGCMDLLLPFAVYTWWRTEDDYRWMGLLRRGIFPCLGIATVILSLSRGGVAALLLEAIGGLILFVPWRSISLKKSGAFIAAAVVGIALLGMVGWKPLIIRFAEVGQHDPSVTYRLKVDASCIDIFKAYPWTGSGFDTFQYAYPRYQLFDNGLTWTEAHNEYLQALAETGAVGLVGILVFFFIYLKSCWFMLRRSGTNRLSKTIGLHRAAFLAVLGFLAHSLVDFQFHIPANALLFFVALAISVPVANASRVVKAPAR